MGDTMDALCGFGFFADLECRLKGWVFCADSFKFRPMVTSPSKNGKSGNAILPVFTSCLYHACRKKTSFEDQAFKIGNGHKEKILDCSIATVGGVIIPKPDYQRYC